MKLDSLKTKDFIFEVIEESQSLKEYTAECSGSRSDCCTRVCTRDALMASEEEWGRFLEINSGVVQY